MLNRIIAVAFLMASIGHAGQVLHVRTLAVEKGEMPQWYVAVADEQFKELKWSANQPSIQIEVQAGSELQLFTKGEGEEGNADYKPVTKVAIPEGAKEVLLLAWPPAEEKEAELRAIADLFQKAEFNDWLVINQSDQPVILRHGKENDPIKLDAGESGIYKIGVKAGNGGEVVAQSMRKGEMKTMYSTFWGAVAKQRSLVLFYTRDGRVKLRRIIDFLPAK